MTSVVKGAPTPPSQSVAAFSLLLGASVIGVYGVSTPSFTALSVGAAIGLISMFLLPRNFVPAVALWTLVLFPGGYIEGVPVLLGRYLTPAVLIVAIWLVRVAFAQRMHILLNMPIRGCSVVAPLLALLLASSAYSVDIGRTLAWLSVFAVCVLAPALLGQVAIDNLWPTLRRTLAGIGLFLGVLASSDYLVHFNPWIMLYDQQHFNFVWASGFRTSTSLGHPLTTALVASVSLGVCLFPSGKTRQWPYVICAVGAVVALVLTVSRSSVIAVGLSAVIGMLAARPSKDASPAHRKIRISPLISACAFLAAVAFSPLLSTRSASAEGSSSATYRSQVLDTALSLIDVHPILGFGPGTSALPFESSSPDGLENSALQLMVSCGVPAFVFLLVGFVIVIATAVKRSRAGVAAAITAFLISAIGFNVVDSNPAILALIAPLIACAVIPGPGASAPTSSALTSRRDDYMAN